MSKKPDAMRSCWECNPGHEGLKQAEGLFVCFECGRLFQDGKFITSETDKEHEARKTRALSYYDDFINIAMDMTAHAIDNLTKWGDRQQVSTLIICMAEELGEVARAELDNRSVDPQVVMRGCKRTEEECMDLGALCLQVALACKNTRESIEKELNGDD